MYIKKVCHIYKQLTELKMGKGDCFVSIFRKNSKYYSFIYIDLVITLIEANITELVL